MLIDSNILIYSINRFSPKHKKAQQFLQENIGRLDIAHQNIFETLRILTYPKFPSPMRINQALEVIDNIIKVCSIIFPSYRTHQIALELIKKYKLASDQVFDAYLAATALDNDIDIIATDNVKDFKKFKEITLVDPF